MTDDHGTGALSCYGSQINHTPNMDRIAHGGMRPGQLLRNLLLVLAQPRLHLNRKIRTSPRANINRWKYLRRHTTDIPPPITGRGISNSNHRKMASPQHTNGL